jgi:large subunit ribosomal protein L25
LSLNKKYFTFAPQIIFTMKTLEIVGYNRTKLGSNDSKKLRLDGSVPCVLYGGKEVKHFHAPMILFRDLVYTPDVHKVILNIEGSIHECIMQDLQFHPVSEVLLHVDFLELSDKPVVMNIPVRCIGTSVGVQKGGRLAQKIRTMKVKAMPNEMPEAIEVDITNLDLGKTIKISDISKGDYAILNSPMTSIATVTIPRSLREQQ